jgi:outer membrane protein TolC
MRKAVAIVAISAGLFGQEYTTAPRFPQSAYFRRHFAETRPQVHVQAPRRLHDFVAGNQLELSIRSYLELVLANNTEIQILRVSIEPQRNAIMRAFAPFDPFVTTSFQITRSTTPSFSALEGAATLSQLRQPLRFSFQQTLESGTQYTVGFEGAKTSSNNNFATFNPALTANFTIGFTQPLLRNRGKYVNRLPILIARSRYEAGRHTLQDQILRILQKAEDEYWTAVELREHLRVQERTLAALDQSLKRYQKEIELGETAPVELYQPQQVSASQEVIVTEVRYRLQQADDALRREIGADLDPAFQDMPLLLTDSVLPALDDTLPDREALLRTAMEKRADLKAALQNLEVDDMLFAQSKNALLPDVSLSGAYTSTGRGGQLLQRTDLFAGDGTLSDIVRTVPGGLGDALGQVFRLGFPTYAFALNLRLPIRDRRAAADLADVTAAKRMDSLKLRELQQQVRLEVLTALSRVESSQKSVKLAQTAVDFAQKRLEAEQRKYDRGVTTVFFLLDAQTSLARVEAVLVAQSAQYRRNVAQLLRVTGTLPERRGVALQ